MRDVKGTKNEQKESQKNMMDTAMMGARGPKFRVTNIFWVTGVLYNAFKQQFCTYLLSACIASNQCTTHSSVADTKTKSAQVYFNVRPKNY